MNIIIKIVLLLGIITGIATLFYIRKRLKKLNDLISKIRERSYLDIIHLISDFLSVKDASVELTDQELKQIIQQRLYEKKNSYQKSIIALGVAIVVFVALLFVNPFSSENKSIALSNPQEHVTEQISNHHAEFMKQNAEMSKVLDNVLKSDIEGLTKDSLRINVEKWITIHNDVTGWFLDDSIAFANGKITNPEMEVIITQTKTKQDSLYNMTLQIDNNLN